MNIAEKYCYVVFDADLRAVLCCDCSLNTDRTLFSILFLALLLSHSGLSKIRLASGSHLQHKSILQFVQSKIEM